MITELISPCNFIFTVYIMTCMLKCENLEISGALLHFQEKTNNVLRRMIFLHCCNVHCFPKIKSKRKWDTIFSSVVLLSDLVAVSSKQRVWCFRGNPQHKSEEGAMLVFRCKYCVWCQFQNVTGDVDFDPVLSVGNKIQVLDLLPKIICKLFSAASEGKKKWSFWCSRNCGLWNNLQHLKSLERSIVW